MCFDDDILIQGDASGNETRAQQHGRKDLRLHVRLHISFLLADRLSSYLHHSQIFWRLYSSISRLTNLYTTNCHKNSLDGLMLQQVESIE
jgi:hypothetical protein